MGGERMRLAAARGHVTTGLRVAIVAASPAIVGGHSVAAAWLAEALRGDGVHVDLVPIDVPLPRGLRWVRRIRGLRTLVNECLYAASLRRLSRADVVHVFSASYWAFLLATVPALAAGRVMGARVVLHYHSGAVADHLAGWGPLVHPWLRLAHEIVVCTEFQRAVFERFGYRARVIPNTVDTTGFRFRMRTPIGPRFICTRNFERHYRVDAAIEAFAAIRAHHADATLTLAGAGPEEGALRALAAEVGGDGIRFAGAVSRADLAALLDRSDVFLNASVVDNQPLSLIEASASGLVVISTPTGGIAEMIEHGRTGLIVPEPDPRRLAQAALFLLSRPDLASAMAQRARDGLARYGWPAIRDEWARAYGRAARLEHPRRAAADTSGPVPVSRRHTA
jgi:glycosyltransferase involved in cell wall biosynthesis